MAIVMCVSVCLSVYVCLCVSVCMCVCLSVCVFRVQEYKGNHMDFPHHAVWYRPQPKIRVLRDLVITCLYSYGRENTWTLETSLNYCFIMNKFP